MSVRRVMGIETEYGVIDVHQPRANPMLLSAQLVTAYAAQGLPAGSGARWDYQHEDPLADARGWRLDRRDAHPSQLTDDPGRPAPAASTGAGTPQAQDADPTAGWDVTVRARPEPSEQGLAVSNVILPNGARYYVDHAHPEYSGPEVLTPRDLVLWDRAGDAVALRSARLLRRIHGMPQIALYKNNTDGKGASYGTHENYLLAREVPFAEVVAMLTPFLATRPVITGSGRVGIGQRGERPGFQLTQRADFVEAEVGLETTLRRPIINTRDEPHADPERYRRLHVIIGDANRMDVPTYLKAGTTALVLWLLETRGVPAEIAATALAEPVSAVHQVSHDPTLTHRLELADGERATALQVQSAYHRAVSAAIAELPAADVDDQTRDVLDRWGSLLERLAVDPAGCAREVEWVAKLRVLEGLRRRDRLDWDHPKLAALDLQWADLRPERSVFARLEHSGAVERLVADAEIEHAIGHPPRQTRAYFRGECVRRYPAAVASASWDGVVFDIPGHRGLQRVPTTEPTRGSAAHVGALLDAHPDPAGLLAALTGGH